MTAIDDQARDGTGFHRSADPHAEVGATLDAPVPQTLGFLDQCGLWANLGVSLLGFTGAIYVLAPGGSGTPRLSLVAALAATVVGTVLGTLAVAVAALPGTRTGAPSMVLLRGLFGGRLSWLPTGVNVFQLVGWGAFELVTIATATHRVAAWMPRWVAVLIAGAVTIALTIRPLGAVRILRRYVGVALVVVLTYLFVQILRHPLPSATQGTWSGFWTATDYTVAVAVSFVPMAADYARHSRSGRTTVAGTLIGYGVAQVVCYVLGILCLLTVARSSQDVYGAFIAVPLGWAAFGILALRELDQSFADVYSTATSAQNILARLDRRVLAGLIGAVCTGIALWVNIGADYQNFLTLLGSVFVPMFGVLAVDFFLGSGRRWDLGPRSASRWLMVVPWVLGFVTYQLINPGSVSWWVSAWTWVRHQLGFHPADWMSASICSFVVAGVLTLVAGRVERRLRAGWSTS